MVLFQEPFHVGSNVGNSISHSKSGFTWMSDITNIVWGYIRYFPEKIINAEAKTFFEKSSWNTNRWSGGRSNLKSPCRTEKKNARNFGTLDISKFGGFFPVLINLDVYFFIFWVFFHKILAKKKKLIGILRVLNFVSILF